MCVAAAAGLVLIPRAPLQLIILGVQVLAGVMLPSAIIFLQLLLNDKELLGEYANKPWNNCGELDHHHRPVRLVFDFGRAGCGPEPVPGLLRAGDEKEKRTWRRR